MSNKGEFLAKVANLASRFDNEDEIMEEAEEYIDIRYDFKSKNKFYKVKRINDGFMVENATEEEYYKSRYY